MRPPVLVTPPATRPVDVNAAKLHLRVDFAAEDDLISTYLDAAISYFDGYGGHLGRCLITQTWRQVFDDFSGCLRLPFPDVDLDSVAVTYLDSAGAEQTLAGTVYEVVSDAIGPYLRLRSSQSWPAISNLSGAVTVEANYGYGTASDVPAQIKTGIFFRLQAEYDRNPEAAEKLKESADESVRGFRRRKL